ncbi:transcription factor BIM1-like isoform X2 [Cynara cardunculus var. scolymus]|uniref:transcription factor BIM1-like isoform X2 n=1 Tax=Cynara cardunculus var. scolymus TaxID=59895 RepID=UPI000D62C4D8|nr:transcription factor BIM1-like isoform X2 [Cynara cardunculus var. scolymus]
MELSQPRPCGAQGAKPTQDFLSLYSPAQQDPTPSIAGGYIRTHDFLQPLEQVGKNVAKEGIEKSFLSGPPTMVEHILPGGMGTYSINHISYINESQKVPKPEGIVTSAAQSSSSNNNDENSNCSSYTGSGFTLWEESNVNRGKTGKENIAGTRHVIRDGGMKVGVPWMTSMERPSQSSSIHNHPSTTFSSLSSSHPSSAPKNQYFLDAVKSAMSVREEEYNDEEFVIKKEPSFHHKGGISVKVGTTNPDQKPDSPRSKHSATEQRRRSKINDRFSMLRGIIPHGDQKRDKASFLLEVIEYIQFLQEKVHKYEDSYQGWTNKPPNMTSLNNIPTKSLVDHQPQLPNNTSRPAFVLDSNTSSLDAIKETTNTSFPVAESFHTHICAPDTASKAQPQLLHSRSCTTDCTGDKLKDQDLIIESDYAVV